MRLNLGATSATGLNWQPGFEQLNTAFFTHLTPTPVQSPYWIARNQTLAEQIGLNAQWFQSKESLEFFSGNAHLPSAPTPYATVYSGHQFGVWAGQLGDGRAITLGEVMPSGNANMVSEQVQGLELQLKGSGRTPYSRGGDGRAVLRSSIREYLCSIAMHGLGIPTTQALCITGSPDSVQRETQETAAVVTRVATGFLRFGHFEHFASRQMQTELAALVRYTSERYYPAVLNEPTPQRQAAALLRAISIQTGILIAHWQSIGFCHGVMNTDNMSALGLTIDYGPFQFLDAFNPQHVCNHSDTQGRYAFNQQPNIAYWNLFCLGQALMPLIGDETQAQQALSNYPVSFNRQFHDLMLAKLGLKRKASDAIPTAENNTEKPAHHQLIEQVLHLLAQHEIDYTIFWRRLSHAVGSDNLSALTDLFPPASKVWPQWTDQYRALYKGQDLQTMSQTMLAANPRFILRNHLAEIAIRDAQQGDFSTIHTLQTLLATPYENHPGYDTYAAPAPSWASSLVISCSS